MKSAARRQKEHVERLSQPSCRRKTVFIRAYSSYGENEDYFTIGIPQDMTQLHQVLDKVNELVGYKLITPIVGLYRQSDRTRVHAVRDIKNNEHLIYVCQGEVQSTYSYTSSQSSDGSMQRLRGNLPPVMGRQSSGVSSPSSSRQQRQQDNANWKRLNSIELDIDNSLVSPQAIQECVNLQRSSAPLPYSSKPTQTQASFRQASPPKQKQDGRQSQQGQQSRTKSLRQMQTMPRHLEHEEQLEFNSAQSVVSGQVSIIGGIPPRRAVSFQERKSFGTYQDFSTDEMITPQGRNSEPRKRRGKSLTDGARSSDNFSFDVPVNEEEEDLSSTPTYASSGLSMSQRVKSDSVSSQVQKVRPRNYQEYGYKSSEDEADITMSVFSSDDPKYLQGADFDEYNDILDDNDTLDTSIDEDFDYSDRSYGIGHQVPKLRLSPIFEPSESPRLMPAIPESDLDAIYHSSRANSFTGNNSFQELYGIPHSYSGDAIRYI